MDINEAVDEALSLFEAPAPSEPDPADPHGISKALAKDADAATAYGYMVYGALISLLARQAA